MVSGIFLSPSSAQQAFAVVVPTTLTLVAPAQVSVGVNFQVNGNLSQTPAPKSPIAGASIQVIFGSQVQYVTTDANGNYVATLTAPPTTGSNLVTADFLGAGGYQGSTASVTVQVIGAVATTLTLILSATTVAPGQAFTASGTLTRNDTGGGVASQQVSLTIDGVAAGSVMTDPSGNYSASLVAPLAAGNHTVGASFAGADPPAELFTSLLYAEAMVPLGMAPNQWGSKAVGIIALLAVGAAVVARKRG